MLTFLVLSAVNVSQYGERASAWPMLMTCSLVFLEIGSGMVALSCVPVVLADASRCHLQVGGVGLTDAQSCVTEMGGICSPECSPLRC